MLDVIVHWPSDGRNAGISIIVSGSSLIRMEDIVTANPNAWFQASLPDNVARIDPLVDRIARARYRTLMLTVQPT